MIFFVPNVKFIFFYENFNKFPKIDSPKSEEDIEINTKFSCDTLLVNWIITREKREDDINS